MTRFARLFLNSFGSARNAFARLVPRKTSSDDSRKQLSESERLFLHYDRLARAQGFTRLCVLLSFDCDTPEDIDAAEKLDAWLSARGLKATYAVPGAQLQQGAAVFRRIADAGADFINHGARPHTEWHDGRYWSITFYHEMPPDQVLADIRDGHAICVDILGKTPIGFRAPHFGNLQTEEQRAMIYAALRELGYRFSSSTAPELALRQGPLIDMGGFYEIPLSGSYAAPLSVLDSWSCVESPYHPVIKQDYADLFIETVRRLLALNVAGLLNYYVDPAHVQTSKAFYQAMEYLIVNGVPAIEFGQALDMAEGK